MELEQVTNFCAQNDIDDSLKEEIVSYLTNKYKVVSKMSLQQEQEVLSLMSESLQKRVLSIKHSKAIGQFKFFEENLSMKTRENLGKFIETMITEPNEVIYSKGEHPEDEELYIYFLHKGKVQFHREFISPYDLAK